VRTDQKPNPENETFDIYLNFARIDGNLLKGENGS
jgi:hypothetical protein